MEINLYNSYHIGDILFNLMILNKFDKYDYKINLYINSSYIYQIKDFITNNNINLLDINTKPNKCINIWIGNNKLAGNIYDNIQLYNNLYDNFYLNFFKNIINIFQRFFEKKFNIDIFFGFEYDIISRQYYLSLSEIILNQFKDIDILFLNNIPNSNQFNYNKEKLDNIGIYLSKKYKIVSLYYINDNIPYTLKYDYKLLQISIISTFTKYIIGINSGPAVACFLVNNIKSKKFYLYDNNVTYTFNNANKNNIDEIYNIF